MSDNLEGEFRAGARAYRARYARSITWRQGKLTNGGLSLSLYINGQQAVLKPADVIMLQHALAQFMLKTVEV